MIVTVEIRGREYEVEAEYEPAEGDGWHEPRYHAGFVVVDAWPIDGGPGDATEEELNEAAERRLECLMYDARR
jgi:hypothetical protein